MTIFVVGCEEQGASKKKGSDRIGIPPTEPGKMASGVVMGCVYVYYFHYDAMGNDNYNLNDEYVTFGNRCSSLVDMTDWTISDKASHYYHFPAFNLRGGSFVTVHTGIGTDTDTELYWGRNSGEYQAVWNNAGDILYLRGCLKSLW